MLFIVVTYTMLMFVFVAMKNIYLSKNKPKLSLFLDQTARRLAQYLINTPKKGVKELAQEGLLSV